MHRPGCVTDQRFACHEIVSVTLSASFLPFFSLYLDIIQLSLQARPVQISLNFAHTEIHGKQFHVASIFIPETPVLRLSRIENGNFERYNYRTEQIDRTINFFLSFFPTGITYKLPHE